MGTKRKIAWICLIALALAIKVLSRWPEVVEKYYSTGLYPVISRAQRRLFGWIPFSFGDLIYGAVLIGLVYGGVVIIRKLIKKKAVWVWFFWFLLRMAFISLSLFVVFTCLWGLHYELNGIAYHLTMVFQPY